MTKVFNKANEIYIRRALRKNMPQSERLLWARLRGKGLNGHKFKRQYSVDKFVLDFYCAQQKLAIEIDGDLHFTKEAEEHDRERQMIIESYSIRFLRFPMRKSIKILKGLF